MRKPLAVGDTIRARGRLVNLDAGARLFVPPDDAMSRWFGLDLAGQVPPDLTVVDVIGEWCDDERITVHRFEPVVDEYSRPGDDGDDYWMPPGLPVDIPTEIVDILDQLPRGLDIQWVQYSVSDDDSGWLSVGTSRPLQVRAALSKLPAYVEADIYPTPWTKSDSERVSDVIGSLVEDDLAVALGGRLTSEGRFVSIVEPIYETQPFLDRLQPLPDGCVESKPWITTTDPAGSENSRP